MGIRLTSKYKDNLIASPKKHIFSRLLDYFSLFVVTYLLFSVFYAVGSRVPAFKNVVGKVTNQNTLIAEYIDSTHLQRLNKEKDALLSVDDGATKYVESLCKTSAYIHELTFPVKQDDNTFLEKTVTVEETFVNNVDSYELDSLSYYFKIFKKGEPSLNNYVYEETDYKEDIDSYLYLKLMNVKASNFVSEDDASLLNRGNGVSRYVVLTKENTNKLLKFFKEDRNDTSLYEEIYLSFINATRYGIDDVEKNSAPYGALYSVYENVYQSLVGAVLIIYLISYVVAYLLLLFIMRLIAREWVTLGQKAMGLAMASNDELDPSTGQIVAYHLLNFVLFITSSVIAFYFLGMTGVLSFKIIGSFTLFALLIFLLVINFASLVMPLVSRNKHDIVTLLTKIYIKDIREFEGPISEPEIPELESNKDYGSK